jgi:predicted GNAT family N-acyltransferase
MHDTFQIKRAHWPEDTGMLRQVRETVFVLEQHVPAELEWDGIDADCFHALAMSQDGQAIGTGRLLLDGHIGRMAVLREWRGRGVGKQLMELLMTEARNNHYPRLLLNSQVSAVPFYERFGFVTRGDEFDSAGIPHLEMILALTDI